jgi:hypothetical protein
LLVVYEAKIFGSNSNIFVYRICCRFFGAGGDYLPDRQSAGCRLRQRAEPALLLRQFLPQHGSYLLSDQ